MTTAWRKALDRMRHDRVAAAHAPDLAQPVSYDLELGLLAVLLLTDARRRRGCARTAASWRWRSRTGRPGTPSGSPRASEALERALRLGRPGSYVAQAAIAALHAQATAWEPTDWPQIAGLYAELERHDPSPVVTLNRAVAVGFADGPAAGLAILDELDADPRASPRSMTAHVATWSP